MDIEVIADAMGHANSNVTRTTYRHALSDRISTAATTFDAILGGVGSRVGLPQGSRTAVSTQDTAQLV